MLFIYLHHGPAGCVPVMCFTKNSIRMGMFYFTDLFACRPQAQLFITTMHDKLSLNNDRLVYEVH